MGILFSRQPPEDYERILSDLLTRISHLESQVHEARHQSRRWSVSIMSYGALLYLLYLLYVFFYPRGPSSLAYRPILDGMGLLLGPLLIYYIRKVVVWLYGRRIASLDSSLRQYRARQKVKVEELKKVTSYYKTKGLIERFDLDEDALNSKGKSLMKSSKPLPPLNQSTTLPVKNPEHQTSLSGQQISYSDPELSNLPFNKFTSLSNGPSSMPPPIPLVGPMSPPPPAPTPPTWLDRLVDAVIGDDRHSRFALICPRCYSHNGLALPEEFDFIQYTCPCCHHFIPPRKNVSTSSFSLSGEKPLPDPPSSESLAPSSDAVPPPAPEDSSSNQITPKQKRPTVRRRTMRGRKGSEKNPSTGSDSE